MRTSFTQTFYTQREGADESSHSTRHAQSIWTTWCCCMTNRWLFMVELDCLTTDLTLELEQIFWWAPLLSSRCWQSSRLVLPNHPVSVKQCTKVEQVSFCRVSAPSLHLVFLEIDRRQTALYTMIEFSPSESSLPSPLLKSVLLANSRLLGVEQLMWNDSLDEHNR